MAPYSTGYHLYDILLSYSTIMVQRTGLYIRERYHHSPGHIHGSAIGAGIDLQYPSSASECPRRFGRQVYRSCESPPSRRVGQLKPEH